MKLDVQVDALAIIAERNRLQQWIDDLQSGMYVNCVYCGHRYGPRETTPVSAVEADAAGTPSMADALRTHIVTCVKHPMSRYTEATRPHPLDEWSERDGPVLWWAFPVTEPPYSGTPLDTDWPGYHTHFTRLLVPSEP